MDKTVKLRAYSETDPSDSSPDKSVRDRIAALEVEQKQAQLEEERNKSLDLLKSVVQLRESLKQEQAKSAELEARITRLSALEDSQFAKKSAQFEEEKKKSLELMRTIEQLKESLGAEQAKSSEVVNSSLELESKIKEISALELKVKDLSGVINRISNLAEAAKAASVG